MMAPMKTTALAVDVTQPFWVPSLQFASVDVQTESDITSSAILMAWKLYWTEKFDTAARRNTRTLFMWGQ